MDNFIIRNRKSLLEEVNKAFPDRKDTSKGYPEIVVKAEEHLDDIVRLTIEKRSWFMYGVDKASSDKKERAKEKARERAKPFSLSYPVPSK